MSEDLRIGKFDRVTVSTDGPDVMLQVPKNPCRAHWTDFAQIISGLQIAIAECQAWEKQNKTGVGRHNGGN